MSASEASSKTFELFGGSVCLDFANTLGGARGAATREYLTNYHDLLRWSKQAGIITEEQASTLRAEAERTPGEAEAVLTRAKALREAIYGLFAALEQGKQIGASDLAILNAELGNALAGGHLIEQAPGLGWEWPAERQGPACMLSVIARSAATLLTAPECHLVRECASHTCSWLFLDSTKNHRRRWCSTTGCGNRAKVRRHRQRQRA